MIVSYRDTVWRKHQWLLYGHRSHSIARPAQAAGSAVRMQHTLEPALSNLLIRTPVPPRIPTPPGRTCRRK